MAISGLRSRFLVELIELYGQAIGSSEHQRVLGRLSERHRGWFPLGGKSLTRPELLFLDDVEELLSALDDPTSGNSARLEAAIAEISSRQITRQALVIVDPSLRSCLLRVIPIVEENWPIRPPTITLDELSSGLRLGMVLHGYSRCTRLLTFQLLGAVKYALQLCAKGAPVSDQLMTVDFFGDRARIDVHALGILPQGNISSVPPRPSSPPPRVPSQRITLRPPGPSLFEQVETILGSRASQPPPPSSRNSSSGADSEPARSATVSRSSGPPSSRTGSQPGSKTRLSTPCPPPPDECNKGTPRRKGDNR